MSEPSLLPQEVLLLCTAWHRASHFPSDHLVGDDWHDYYEAQLEKTMAAWLQEGLLAWQVGTRRASAFVPVAHLIGTSREDLSYVESLGRLVTALMPERDHHYRQPADAYKDERSDVLLGTCLGNAAALAVKGLAAQWPRAVPEAHRRYAALLDALALVQIVKPFKAEEPLCDAWEYLFAGPCPVDRLGAAYAHSLRHQFVLAMFPVVHAGMRGHRIARLVEGIYNRHSAAFGSAGWPDLRATRAMLFAVDYDPVADPRFERPPSPQPDWQRAPHWLRITSPF